MYQEHPQYFLRSHIRCYCTGGDEARNCSMACHRDFQHQVLLEIMNICYLRTKIHLRP